MIGPIKGTDIIVNQQYDGCLGKENKSFRHNILSLHNYPFNMTRKGLLHSALVIKQACNFLHVWRAVVLFEGAINLRIFVLENRAKVL